VLSSSCAYSEWDASDADWDICERGSVAYETDPDCSDEYPDGTDREADEAEADDAEAEPSTLWECVSTDRIECSSEYSDRESREAPERSRE
jgi:hypothetical protein